LLLSMAILVLIVSGPSAVEPPEGRAFLTSTNWSASVFSHNAGGSVCWIMGEDGSVRVEVLLDPEGTGEDPGQAGSGGDVNLEALMSWTGDGWTLVLGPDGNGTLNGWGKEWEMVPADLSSVVRLITASLQNFPIRPVEFSFASSVGQSRGKAGIPRPGILGSDANGEADADVWRYQLTSSDTPGFRKKMTARGRGAGGMGEILVLHWWQSAGQDGYALAIGSSRRPGTLNLGPPRNLAVDMPDPEVFLPLWPLSQFFEAR
jgi:hypothetical protein